MLQNDFLFWRSYVAFFVLLVIAVMVLSQFIRAFRRNYLEDELVLPMIGIIIGLALAIGAILSPGFQTNPALAMFAWPVDGLVPIQSGVDHPMIERSGSYSSGTTLENAYWIKATSTLVINPREPSHYDEKIINVSTSVKFLFEGTNKLPYYALLETSFKPCSVAMSKQLALRTFSRNRFQWFPLDRLRDDRVYREVATFNGTVVIQQKDYFTRQVEQALVAYLETHPQPNAKEAEEILRESLEKDWQLSDFTLTRKTNNW